MPGPAARVRFVGLTGGLGAGKSTALAAAAELGAATLSTDEVVHDLLATEELRKLLVERFGPEVAPAGSIDRSAVAAKVFNQPDERQWLEGQLWPRVGERVAAWRRDLEQAEEPPAVAVVETPLLFEAGLEAVYDCTIAVVAEESVRDERARARGHEAVGERSGRQLSQEEKSQRADFTLRNDGTRDELKSQLSRVLASIAGGSQD